jgi:uncharacterized protein
MVRTIGLEEHAWTPDICEGLLTLAPELADESLNPDKFGSRLFELGAGRIAHMDDAGIDMQVLSITTPGVQPLGRDMATQLAREANNQLAAVVDTNPERFAAFATLPIQDPSAAAHELERAVSELGLVGAMLFPRVGDLYLDDLSFDPIFDAANTLGVPLYLHPQIPPRGVRNAYYDGFPGRVDIVLATGGWGWHMDAGLAAIRLMLAGTFDRHPDLKLILGHWGEMVVFYLERIDMLSDAAPHLQRRIADYVATNLYITPSGMFSYRMLMHALSVVGADHILFSTDYPFQFAPEGGARSFIDLAPISTEDKAKIGHSNAERLLRLGG